MYLVFKDVLVKEFVIRKTGIYVARLWIMRIKMVHNLLERRILPKYIFNWDAQFWAVLY
jgi:hypothetical protein